MGKHGMTHTKTTDSLVRDIYEVMTTKQVPTGVDLELEIDRFGENCKRLMTNLFTEQRDKRTLRMSNIGRDDRFLWHVVHNSKKESFKPNVLVKFMYGHLIEEMLVFLTRLSGHEVTDEQKQCDIDGIKGHMDCRIDGVITDIKSASSFAFKKFRFGTLFEDDPFGYVMQLEAYAEAEGDTEYGWLAMDKQHGYLTYLKGEKKHDVKARVAHLKDVVAQDVPPADLCADPIPEGKAGNMKLDTKCSYCVYKSECFDGLRAFKYSKGPVFFSYIAKEPQVEEIHLEEDSF